MTEHKKIVFIGPLGGGKTPTNGASFKNYYLSTALREALPHTVFIDTEGWKRNPALFLKLIKELCFAKNTQFIVSANSFSANKLMRVMLSLGITDILYWVIGGKLPDLIRSGLLHVEPYRKLKTVFVEGHTMKQKLLELGVDRVEVIPNFKFINYVPAKPEREPGSPARFVFLSRIMSEKGCSLILDAANRMNRKGLSQRFTIDFYGPIAPEYEHEFQQRLADNTSNCCYRGFLNLQDQKNYDILASYDIMLFPTMWEGEGFPGVIIDAYIAGLPVIASRWSMNEEVVHDQKTGFIIPPNDAEALADRMEQLIHLDIRDMSLNCQSVSGNYDVRNIVTMEFLKRYLD